MLRTKVTDDNIHVIRHMRCVCWIRKARNTLSECVILLDFRVSNSNANALPCYVVRTFPVLFRIGLFNKVLSDHNRKYKFYLIIHKGLYSLYFWPADFIGIRLMVWEPNHVGKYFISIMHTFGAPSIKSAWKYRFGINCILCI